MSLKIIVDGMNKVNSCDCTVHHHEQTSLVRPTAEYAGRVVDLQDKCAIGNGFEKGIDQSDHGDNNDGGLQIVRSSQTTGMRY